MRYGAGGGAQAEDAEWARGEEGASLRGKVLDGGAVRELDGGSGGRAAGRERLRRGMGQQCQKQRRSDARGMWKARRVQ